MRHFDFAPLYRSTVGFDRFAQMLDQVTNVEETGYPPYNIERLSENGYRITMAVAGFTNDDIAVEVKESNLTVKAAKTGTETEKDEATEFLHRGIATRSFERRFQLADYVEVVGADLKDGLLHIDLERNLPERMKPRTIAVGTANGSGVTNPQIEEVRV